MPNWWGRRCLVQFLLKSVKPEVLWDTGAQVSIVSKDWIAKNLLTAKRRQMAESFNGGGLDLQAATCTEIPY